MKKFYLVNYAYLSQNRTIELRAKRATQSWARFTLFGSIRQLWMDFLIKSALCEKSLFRTRSEQSQQSVRTYKFRPFVLHYNGKGISLVRSFCGAKCRKMHQSRRNLEVKRFGQWRMSCRSLFFGSATYKKVYLVNYAYLSRNWMIELRVKRATQSWARFNPFGSIAQLLIEFLMKSAIYEKSLFINREQLNHERVLSRLGALRNFW